LNSLDEGNNQNNTKNNTKNNNQNNTKNNTKHHILDEQIINRWEKTVILSFSLPLILPTTVGLKHKKKVFEWLHIWEKLMLRHFWALEANRVWMHILVRRKG